MSKGRGAYAYAEHLRDGSVIAVIPGSRTDISSCVGVADMREGIEAMPDQPVPLREALKAAIQELVAEEVEYTDNRESDVLERVNAAQARVNALIEQVPADIEVNDAG